MMIRKPAKRESHSMGQRAMHVCYLCASLSPSLAGLPYLMEYLWNHMNQQRSSAWRRTSQ